MRQVFPQQGNRQGPAVKESTILLQGGQIMTQFLKMLLLITTFDDDASRYMVFCEWLRDDPTLDTRFEMACRMEDMVG